MVPNLLLLNTFSIVMLSITGVLLIAVIVLFFLGKRLDKKQAEQQKFLDENRQNVSMLIIDKKKVRFKDAGFPQVVVDQAPKMSKFMKVPVVKAKIGPQIVTMFVDEKIFDALPIKKEVKAEISGMYIISVKGMHGTVIKKDEKKKGFFKRALEKAQEKAGATSVK